jgi:hypothetical protein
MWVWIYDREDTPWRYRLWLMGRMLCITHAEVATHLGHGGCGPDADPANRRQRTGGTLTLCAVVLVAVVPETQGAELGAYSSQHVPPAPRVPVRSAACPVWHIDDS